MNIKTTIAMVIIAVVLAAAFIYKYRQTPTTAGSSADGIAGATTDSGARVFDPKKFDPDKVTEIRLTPKGQPTYVFKKDGDDWNETEPMQFAMNGWQIRMLATAAADLTIAQTVKASDLTGDIAPDKIGLAPPLATIVFSEGGKDSEQSLQLGIESVGGKGFVRLRDGGDVYIVDDGLHKRVLDSHPREWRNNQVFHNVGQSASRITVECREPGRTIKLQKNDGKWRLVLPVNTAAEESAVNQFISTIAATRVDSYVDDDPKDVSTFGVDKPWATVTVETDTVGSDSKIKTDRQAVALGNPFDVSGSARYGQIVGRKPVFKLASDTVDSLIMDPAKLVSKAAVTVPASDIQALKVQGPDSEYTLTRTKDGWEVKDAATGKAQPGDKERIDNLLLQLTTAGDRTEILKIGAKPEGSYMGRIAVTRFNENDPMATIALYRHDMTRPKKPGDTAEGNKNDEAAAKDATETVVELLFDDGSGAIRAKTVSDVPDLGMATYTESGVKAEQESKSKQGPPAPEGSQEPMK